MEDILDIISYFKKDKAILIGHDWGAPIYWTTAAYYKEKVSAIIGLSVLTLEEEKFLAQSSGKGYIKSIFIKTIFKKLVYQKKS